jgi:hypothetical protein
MTHHPDFPAGLTAESAMYALDGPRDQQIADLRRIAAAASRHGTPASLDLAEEAIEFLDELEAE